jgi:hypothetical protein
MIHLLKAVDASRQDNEVSVLEVTFKIVNKKAGRIYKTVSLTGAKILF